MGKERRMKVLFRVGLTWLRVLAMEGSVFSKFGVSEVAGLLCLGRGNGSDWRGGEGACMRPKYDEV